MKTLIKILEQSSNRPQFASFTYHSKSSGEVARHTLLLNADYVNLCEKDILELEILLQTATGIEKICAEELLKSKRESIQAKKEGREHSGYTKAGMYRNIAPNIAINLNDNSLELRGISIAKKVLVAGTYPTVNSRPKTIAKDKIRKTLSADKYRSFALDKGYALAGKVNGNTIEFPE